MLQEQEMFPVQEVGPDWSMTDAAASIATEFDSLMRVLWKLKWYLNTFDTTTYSSEYLLSYKL